MCRINNSKFIFFLGKEDDDDDLIEGTPVSIIYIIVICSLNFIVLFLFKAKKSVL